MVPELQQKPIASLLDESTEAVLRTAAADFGTPCYVYFIDQIIAQARSITEAFDGRFAISYAMKANPNRHLLQAIKDHVGGIDVSSEGELRAAIAAGCDPASISFTGPGKSPGELSAAVELSCGEIVAESLSEIEDINRLSLAKGVVTRILIRVSPQAVPKGFGVSMAGRPSQFGIDEEALDSVLPRFREFPGVHLAGFHIYAGAQCLNTDSIVENFRNYIRIFSDFSIRHGIRPETLVFGGGIGIPYHHGEKPVDLPLIAEAIVPLLDDLRSRPEFSGARFLLEIGRLLVGEAGYFLTTVRRAKHSRGREIRICDGGLNNHLAACGHFGTIIHRNYLISRLGHDQHRPIAEDTAFDVFGPLCTTIDQLARGLCLPALHCGDVLAIHSSGAYGFSASPMRFISHPPAREIALRREGNVLQLHDVTPL
jgi:diaminopimelate decarboxylase